MVYDNLLLDGLIGVFVVFVVLGVLLVELKVVEWMLLVIFVCVFGDKVLYLM